MHRALCPRVICLFLGFLKLGRNVSFDSFAAVNKAMSSCPPKNINTAAVLKCKIDQPSNSDSWMLKKDDPNPSFSGPGRHWRFLSGAELLNFGRCMICVCYQPHRISMCGIFYIPTFTIIISTIHVGKIYTIPMNPHGNRIA